MANFQIQGAPTCKVVYPQGLFEKRAVKGVEGSPKYNAIFLIPKSDPEKVGQVLEMFGLAFAELQAKGFKGKNASAIDRKNNCLVDGDAFADSKEGKEAFRGYYMLKCSSPQVRPIVADMAGRTILNGVPLAGLPVEKISDEQLNDGDHVFVNVSFWTYNNTTVQGIGCNVNAVKRAGEGTRVGGASGNVEDYLDTAGYE